MDGREYPHRDLVGVLVGDLLVDVEQVAVALAHPRLAEAADRLRKVEVDAEPAHADAAALVADALRRARRDVAVCRPEVVLHLAAQSVVRTSYEDPVQNYSSNVMGMVHLLESVRQLRQPCAVVNVTSDKC